MRIRKLMLVLAGGIGVAAVGASAEAQSRFGRFAVPPGHMPPPGQCRVWLPDRPPGHQPPPTSCRRAERLADRFGGRVIYGMRDWRGDRWDHSERWQDRRWRDRWDEDRRWRDRDDGNDDDRRRWRDRRDDDDD